MSVNSQNLEKNQVLKFLGFSDEYLKAFAEYNNSSWLDINKDELDDIQLKIVDTIPVELGVLEPMGNDSTELYITHS